MLDLCFILGVSRNQLGITASAKGMLLGQSAASITQIRDDMEIDLSNTEFILIVEKDTIFVYLQ